MKIEIEIGFSPLVMTLLGKLIGEWPAPAKVAAEPKGSTAEVAATKEIPEDKTVAESSDDIDAAGHSWSKDLHASTKAKTGAGLWRMAPGKTRPDPLPGFPKSEDTSTGTGSAGAASKPSATATTSDVEEEDEFAAFTAANKGTSTAAAPAARTWSDTDLSKLNNQAAQTLGSADKVKALVAEYVPAGAVQHSRMIPVDKREEYAVKLEALAGIEFEG